MTQSTGRVALVTGGSRGIGLATSKRLAADGCTVVVNYAGNTVEAEKAVAEIGGDTIAVQADIADETAVAAMFDRIEAEFGGIDVVVNAAGIMILAPLVDFDLAALDRMHRVNIRGAFVVSQEAARRVRSGGAIIHISSTVTKLSMPTYAAYTMSKSAVDGLTLIMARELRGRDITVNAVAPGPTATALFLEGKDEATIARMAAAPPLERLGRPEDPAEVIAFLAGPGRWVNGQIVYVNGGIA
ncbi:MAG TPA: SDR family oxidoreductase [Pseudonocardiaceae bacterium]|nr:SDR family oxidoreductase [Pseudonocardiaceae bacterium]